MYEYGYKGAHRVGAEVPDCALRRSGKPECAEVCLSHLCPHYVTPPRDSEVEKARVMAARAADARRNSSAAPVAETAVKWGRICPNGHPYEGETGDEPCPVCGVPASEKRTAYDGDEG